MYKKGIGTKDNILQASKKIFYRKGFKAASVNEICQACNIKLGTFTYYYSKKDDLLRDIYDSYMYSCEEYVKSKNMNLSSAQLHLYIISLYYFNIYRDNNVVAFHNEIMKQGSMNDVFNDSIILMKRFSMEGNIQMDDPSYSLYVVADNAVRRELNLDFMKDSGKTVNDVKQLLTEVYTVTARIFGMDQHKLEEYLEEATEFAINNMDCGISLLI